MLVESHRNRGDRQSRRCFRGRRGTRSEHHDLIHRERSFRRRACRARVRRWLAVKLQFRTRGIHAEGRNASSYCLDVGTSRFEPPPV